MGQAAGFLTVATLRNNQKFSTTGERAQGTFPSVSRSHLFPVGHPSPQAALLLAPLKLSSTNLILEQIPTKPFGAPTMSLKDSMHLCKPLKEVFRRV